MTTLTYEAVEAEVRKLAAARPDYIYRPPGSDYDEGECSYFPYEEDGETHGPCIIGQALRNLGLIGDTNEETADMPTFVTTSKARAEAASSTASSDRIAAAHSYTQAPYYVRRRVTWFGDVQSKQDGGSAWYDAVAHADRVRRGEDIRANNRAEQ